MARATVSFGQLCTALGVASLVLNQILNVIWQQRRAAGIAFSLVILGATLFYVFAPRRYEAETLLLIGQAMKEQAQDGTVSKEITSQLNSLGQLSQTEDVMLEAARKVGVARLIETLTNVERFREGQDPNTTNAEANLAILVSALRRAVSTKIEGKSDLLKIQFRNSDPVIAAEFTNRLAEALIGRQLQLSSQPDALSFFQKQKKRLEDEVQRASNDLTEFTVSTSTYSVAEQRQLLLKRASELAASLAATRSELASKEAQRSSLSDQLRKMKALNQSPAISGLVDSLGTPPVNQPTKPSAGPDAEGRSFNSEPPIMLVKVYQESMANLLKINTDLAALNGLQNHQASEMQKINDELSMLSRREATFLQLKREVDLASASAEIYGKRIMEEQVSADLAKARLSNLRVAQHAFVPAEPSFPRLSIVLPFGLLAGIMAAIAAAFAWNALVQDREIDWLPLHPDVVANDTDNPKWPLNTKVGEPRRPSERAAPEVRREKVGRLGI